MVPALSDENRYQLLKYLAEHPKPRGAVVNELKVGFDPALCQNVNLAIDIRNIIPRTAATCVERP